MKYVDLLKKEKVSTAEDYRHIAAVAEKELELTITKQEVELAKANEVIHKSKVSAPLDTNGIVDALNSKELLERRIKQLKSLKLELFG
jgi:hypothetical protein